MNSSFQKSFVFRDLLHALVLLCAVPLLFFGAFRLLNETREIDPDLPPQPIDGPLNIIKPAMEVIFPPKPPAPGETWLQEITLLEQKLNDIGLTTSAPRSLIDGVRTRLTDHRRHCETFIDEVPTDIAHSDLGQSLTRIGNEVQSLEQPKPTLQATVNLEAVLQSSEREWTQEQNRQIQRAFELMSQPVAERHRTQMTNVARENREMQDQLQLLKEQADKIRRDTESQLAKNARKQAYEEDRDEIQRLLSPFISRAYSQLGEYYNSFQKTADPQPLSYCGLERLGAMEPNIKGLTLLGEIGSSPYRYQTNTRPMGAFPIFDEFTFNRPAQLEAVKRAQELLRKHSVYLIEAGLLFP